MEKPNAPEPHCQLCSLSILSPFHVRSATRVVTLLLLPTSLLACLSTLRLLFPIFTFIDPAEDAVVEG
jgi:hypothetical protein